MSRKLVPSQRGVDQRTNIEGQSEHCSHVKSSLNPSQCPVFDSFRQLVVVSIVLCTARLLVDFCVLVLGVFVSCVV